LSYVWGDAKERQPILIGLKEWLEFILVRRGAEVKSLLASNLGRTWSIEARILSKDGLARSDAGVRAAGISRGGSREFRAWRLYSVPSLPFWLRALWVPVVGATEGGKLVVDQTLSWTAVLTRLCYNRRSSRRAGRLAIWWFAKDVEMIEYSLAYLFPNDIDVVGIIGFLERLDEKPSHQTEDNHQKEDGPEGSLYEDLRRRFVEVGRWRESRVNSFLEEFQQNTDDDKK
jgi:hypothetical protein